MRRLISYFALMFASTCALAVGEGGMCPDVRVHTSTRDGLVEGFYESGYLWEDEFGCYEPWQFIQVLVNPRPHDLGLAGMMYIGAFDKRGNMDGAVLRPDGGWEPYHGGIHEPTAAFEKLSPTRFTVFDSRVPESQRRRVFGMWRPIARQRPPGPETICQLMAQHGKSHMELGGGYGAVQAEAQARIDQLIGVPGMELDLDHLRAAFAYNDGLQDRKYGPVFEFDCGCSFDPLEAGPRCPE